MKTNDLFGLKRVRKSRSARRAAGKERPEPGFQKLEPRKMFAVGITYDAIEDVLNMSSDDASDTVEVSSHNGFLNVMVNGIKRRSQWLSGNPVQRLQFDGHGGSDIFRNWTSIHATANGGQGDDVLEGGSGTDVLNGGPGVDTLKGGSGTDYLFGGTEGDFLNGDGGVDYLWGQEGADNLYGGGGNDFLYGGSENDVLQGARGDDLLNGGGGDDIYHFVSFRGGTDPNYYLGSDRIEDASGTDKLDFTYSAFGVQLDLGTNWQQNVKEDLRLRILPGTVLETVIGSNHDDVLRGNDAQNALEGRGGNDRLYGRGGIDGLFGGEGDDGMYGGAGFDILVGGTGDDRYLIGPNDPDGVIGFSPSEDARVLFNNGTALTNQGFAGRDPLARWNIAAGNWTDGQIERVDQALDRVQRATGNTRLLKRANDPLGTNPLTYVMQGAATQVSGPQDLWGIGGWNANGTVVFVNGVNANTVYHEIGHNWDQAGEISAARRTEWENLSGWVNRTNSPGSTHCASLGVGDNWWHRNTAVFAEDYGRMNPEEDMATTFEAYFNRTGNTAVDCEGRSVGATGSVTADNIPLKIAFLDRLFASLG